MSLCAIQRQLPQAPLCHIRSLQHFMQFSEDLGFYSATPRSLVPESYAAGGEDGISVRYGPAISQGMKLCLHWR
jgi:hypothetical protein